MGIIGERKAGRGDWQIIDAESEWGDGRVLVCIKNGAER